MNTQIDKDYRYIKRREMLSARQRYLGIMVDKLNGDKTFKDAMVNFSCHSNNFHFVERFSDRDLAIDDVLPKFYQIVLKNRMKIVEYCHMTPQPKRLEIDFNGVRIGLSGLGTNLTFRTVYNKYTDRLAGRTTNYLISDKNE